MRPNPYAFVLLGLLVACPGASAESPRPGAASPQDQFATYHDHGARLVEQGRLEEALPYLDTAVRMRPRSVLAL